MTPLNTIIEEGNTPDTEKMVVELTKKYHPKDLGEPTSILENAIREAITSRDTYWKERVRKEKLGWEGYVVVDPQSNNYKCSPIFSSVKEAEKWRRDFGESALKVATVDVILKN